MDPALIEDVEVVPRLAKVVVNVQVGPEREHSLVLLHDLSCDAVSSILADPELLRVSLVLVSVGTDDPMHE